MDSIQDALRGAIEELLGRASGPLHARLILQPCMAAFFAIRAGMRDAREGRPAFLWEMFRRPEERGALLRSAWKDVGKLFAIALTLDVVYQVLVFRTVHPVQTLLVAVVLALLPYALLRGPVTRLTRPRRG